MDKGYTMEVKKDAMRQNQDGSWKVTINVHPDDMSSEFLSDAMGQRYMTVFVAIGDDEQPIQKPVSKAGEGKLLAKDDMLGSFLLNCYASDLIDGGSWSGERAMKHIIGIKSCSELIEGSKAYERFKEFRTNFYKWKRDTQQEQHYTRN